jgi:transposase-like protein
MNRKPRGRHTAEFKAQAIALRRELARIKMENDIFKKAAVILGTSPRPESVP